MGTSSNLRAAVLPGLVFAAAVGGCAGSNEAASTPTVDLSPTSTSLAAPSAEPEPVTTAGADGHGATGTAASTAATAPVDPPAAPARSEKTLQAEALFREGREAMSQGDFAAACKKFDASLKIEFGVGTLVNLAECNARSGDRARACALYGQAAAELKGRGDAREAMVLAKRAALGCGP